MPRLVLTILRPIASVIILKLVPSERTEKKHGRGIINLTV